MVPLANQTQPDVGLMDIRMPVLDRLAATEAIFLLDLATKVLVLTTFDVDEYVDRTLRAGASGFLLKDTPPAELLRVRPSTRRRPTNTHRPRRTDRP